MVNIVPLKGWGLFCPPIKMHQSNNKILIDDGASSIERQSSRDDGGVAAPRGGPALVAVPAPAVGASNIDVSASAPALMINDAKLLANFTQTPSRYLTTLETNRRASINILSENLNRRRTIQHRVKSWIAPSNTPANVKIFGGKRAIHIEQLRSRAAGWVIHPYSSLRYVSLIWYCNRIRVIWRLPLDVSTKRTKQSGVTYPISELLGVL